MTASRRRQLGQQLKAARLAAGFERMDDAAKASGVSRATISRGERGEQKLSERTIRDLCLAYSVDAPMVDHLVRLAREAHEGGWYLAHAGVAASWFERYLSEEAEAATIYIYATDCVFGPAQVETYARDLIVASTPNVTDQQITKAISLRASRLANLLRDDAPAVHVVMGEAAIRYKVSDPDTMRQQYEQLIELSEREQARRGDKFTIQVLPFSAGAHPGNNGSFTILQFADTEPTIYQEVYGGAVYPSGPSSVEYMTWIHNRLRNRALAPEATRDFLRRLVAES